MNDKRVLAAIVLVLLLVLLPASGVVGQGEGTGASVVLGTGFTYQGELTDGGGHPVSASCDFSFGLWDAASGGAQIGTYSAAGAVAVTQGRFTALVNAGGEFGANAFVGQARWLQVALRCPAGSGSYATLTPRQPLAAAPHSLYAASAPWGGLGGVPAGFADGSDADALGALSCGNSQVAKWNGSAWTCAADQTGAGSYWSLTGNAETAPGMNYLGTSDNAALEIRVNGARAMRLEPGSSPNLLGGYSGNLLTAGVVGATVGGGGSSGWAQRVTDSYGTVSGGTNNRAGDGTGTVGDASYATVGGGLGNTAQRESATIGGGAYNNVLGAYGTVAGGDHNHAYGQNSTVAGGGWNEVIGSGSYAFIGGGYENSATEPHTTVAGGTHNTASGQYATVSGGRENTASDIGASVGGGTYNSVNGQYATVGGGTINYTGGKYATVGGGSDNLVIGSSATVGGGSWNQAPSAYATVGGGYTNFAQGDSATVSGGYVNIASGDRATVGGGGHNIASGTSATVGGGRRNSATAQLATIGGGGDNEEPDLGNRVTDDWGTVGGGHNNQAGDDAGDTSDQAYATVGGGGSNTASGGWSTVSGGWRNTASGETSTVGGGLYNDAIALDSTVSGGWGNTASSDYAAVGGGESNHAGGQRSTVGGGFDNTATGPSATVGGGWTNTAGGNAATVPGGAENVAGGGYSFAAGAQAHATHDGSFVWSSATATDSWGTRTFTARSHGGARFYTAAGTATGVQLSAGGTSWNSISDRNAKEAFAPVDTARLLEVLASMPVQTWNLKSQSPAMRHIGPVAQDFNGSFTYLLSEVESPIHINNMDAVGVSLAASQGLYELSQDQAIEIAGLQAENAVLREQLGDLEARLEALEAGQRAGRAPVRLPFGWLLLGGGVLVVGAVVGRRTWGGGR